MFYQRNEKGIPVTWLARMRESMARLTPQFSANRTVREYTEKHYLPAATAYRKRGANSGLLAEEVVKWQNRMGQHWHTIRFGSLKVQCSNQEHEFVAEVYLNQVLSDSVSVELYAEPYRSGAAVRIPMARGAKMTGSVDGFVYTGRAPSSRPASDYTVRVVPSKSGVLVPLEVNSIVWQKT
jgi:glycogen phosphorylase